LAVTLPIALNFFFAGRQNPSQKHVSTMMFMLMRTETGPLDLLHNLRMRKFFVVDGGDEEEAQAKAAAAVSVAVGDDVEAFKHGDDVLASYALAGDSAVSGLVDCG
jgi:hypothetical protein